MLTQLALSSWETIFRRGLLMASGRCTPAEYRRMAAEKTAAAQASALVLARGPAAAFDAALAPWHRRARANAKRLRKP